MEYHNPTKRVLSILELIDINPNGLSLTAISEKLCLPKGTISPILKTLTAMNYIRLENGVYQIGFKSFELGLSFYGKMDSLSMIQAEMQDIVRLVGEICQMGILSGRNVFYVLKENSNEPIEIVSAVGRKIPAHMTGLGKALLSGKSDHELQALYADYTFEACTPKTVTGLDALLQQIHSVRKTGLAFENEESQEGICCVAVPLKFDGQVKAAISVTIPKFRYNSEKKSLIPSVLLQKKKLIEEIALVQGRGLDI